MRRDLSRARLGSGGPAIMATTPGTSSPCPGPAGPRLHQARRRGRRRAAWARAAAGTGATRGGRRSALVPPPLPACGAATERNRTARLAERVLDLVAEELADHGGGGSGRGGLPRSEPHRTGASERTGERGGGRRVRSPRALAAAGGRAPDRPSERSRTAGGACRPAPRGARTGRRTPGGGRRTLLPGRVPRTPEAPPAPVRLTLPARPKKRRILLAKCFHAASRGEAARSGSRPDARPGPTPPLGRPRSPRAVAT